MGFSVELKYPSHKKKLKKTIYKEYSVQKETEGRLQ